VVDSVIFWGKLSVLCAYVVIFSLFQDLLNLPGVRSQAGFAKCRSGNFLREKREYIEKQIKSSAYKPYKRKMYWTIYCILVLLKYGKSQKH